ncbi:hypothetical protein NUW54_g1741 [Trametes sanguinea]|uniref:Uncharacterized protein n=1 Tax=Trametes sanguinea TaxID=158606 RepID=A0ACC1Q5R5_9APHY|nr:hypothetical protein NUW54_g1741 [Trametes sanguinea]
MPKKGTKPKTTPVPSPLPSENPATQTRGRPPRSAKAKAAAAWQLRATTRKRMQADVLADAADAPVAPKPKRVRPGKFRLPHLPFCNITTHSDILATACRYTVW